MPLDPEKKFEHLNWSAQGKVIVLTFRANVIVGEGLSKQIGAELYSVVEEHGCINVVLDFSNVTKIESVLLSPLISMDKKIKAANGRLVLCSLCADVYEYFVITKLTKLFVLKDKQKDALSYLR